MRVKALVDHVNDFSLSGHPGVALGEDRAKKKGVEYDIPDDDYAKMLVAGGTVEEVKKGKA